jgi:hypothetical protein
MSFSLQIANGDLVQRGSQLGIVYGANKLQQDMVLWLSERYGIDRFHPAYGSNFQNYIGGIIGYSTQSMVYNEAMRVLDNYQKVQFLAFKANPSLFSLSELLYSINSVNVSVSYDTVNVSVNVSNGQQQTATVNVSQGT